MTPRRRISDDPEKFAEQFNAVPKDSTLHSGLPRSIDLLVSDDFLYDFGMVSTVNVLYAKCRRSQDVQEVISNLSKGLIEEEEVNVWADLVLQKFIPGQTFDYDISLAAMLFALDASKVPWGLPIIQEAAGLDVGELMWSRHMAKKLLRLAAERTEEREKIDETQTT